MRLVFDIFLACRPRLTLSYLFLGYSWTASKAPPDLIGNINLHPKLFGKGPYQSWILLEHAPTNGKVETLFEQLICLFAGSNGPDCANGNFTSKFVFDSFGERLVVVSIQFLRN